MEPYSFFPEYCILGKTQENSSNQINTENLTGLKKYCVLLTLKLRNKNGQSSDISHS